MFRKVISLLTALSLIFGSVAGAPSLAQSAPSVGQCKAPKPFTWQKLGGAPFARTEAEAMKKLPQALKDMVTAGCLPEGAVPALLKLVQDNPKGTSVDGTTKLVTLSNGMRLDFMESAKHYFVDVIVGLVNVGRGLVAGVQAKVWAFSYNGVIYYLYMPLICFNWSLAHQGAPPVQAHAQERCVLIRTQFDPLAHKANHFGFGGPDAMKGDCWRWRYEGEATWRSYRECLDTCDYRSIESQIGNIPIVFKGRTDFAQPSKARWVEYSVSRTFAESRNNIALFCLERRDGMMSCGKMVRTDDYHADVASIYLSKEGYTAAHAVGRPLIWDFFADPKDCLKFWTH